VAANNKWEKEAHTATPQHGAPVNSGLEEEHA
jgi:hypothetical protein